MGAGIIEANRTGGTVKRVHCGWAAHAGISAAQLAAAGLTGPITVFEGRFGFLQAYLDERSDPEALTSALGQRWEVLRIFFKPYPTNHFTHAGIDAARQLLAGGLNVDEIEEIEYGAPTAVLRTIAQPEAEKARPATGYSAQFSGPFTVATALLGGGGLGVTLDDITDDAVRDARALALAARVRCVPDAACDRIFPNQFPAVLRVRLKDGQVREARINANWGGPEHPLSDAELDMKFRLNAGRTLSSEQVDRLRQVVYALETDGSVEQVLAPLYTLASSDV